MAFPRDLRLVSEFTGTDGTIPSGWTSWEQSAGTDLQIASNQLRNPTNLAWRGLYASSYGYVPPYGITEYAWQITALPSADAGGGPGWTAGVLFQWNSLFAPARTSPPSTGNWSGYDFGPLVGVGHPGVSARKWTGAVLTNYTLSMQGGNGNVWSWTAGDWIGMQSIEGTHYAYARTDSGPWTLLGYFNDTQYRDGYFAIEGYNDTWRADNFYASSGLPADDRPNAVPLLGGRARR
jgi:hypothetical protein